MIRYNPKMDSTDLPGLAGEVSQCLAAIREGDRASEERLLQLVFTELRRIAANIMRSERVDHTLQPTALVNEVYLRLLSGSLPTIRDRSHFFRLAAQAMRRILVDHARAGQSQKRGGEFQRIELDLLPVVTRPDFPQVLELDEALQRLERVDARQCRIVELRFFAGLDEEEIAELLSISSRTVKRDWRMAKAWLYGELSASSTGGSKRATQT